MQIKAQLKSYEALDFSVTLTAPVADWRAALKHLEQLKSPDGYIAWPLSGVACLIEKVLLDLDKTHRDTASRPALGA